MSNELTPLPADVSLATKDMIGMIARIKNLEEELPLLNSIEEIEKRRAACNGVQSYVQSLNGKNPYNRYGKEIKDWQEIGHELEQWAERVAIMCQRRVGQLFKDMPRNKGGRPIGKTSTPSGEVSKPPLPPSVKKLGLSHNFVSEAQTLAAIPEEQLQEKLDQQMADGGIKKKKLIKEIKAKAKAQGETIDDKTARDRARWHEKDVKKQQRINQARPAEPRLTSSQKFERYWTKERKLLNEFFEISDLEKVAEHWWKNFHQYRAEEEKILLEAKQDRDRRRALVELSRP